MIAAVKTHALRPMSSPQTAVLDARLIPCSGKHELIFRRWSTLAVGESFTLLNDHRPEPLRQQFAQHVPGCFDWRETKSPSGGFAVTLTRLQPDPVDFDSRIVNGCGGSSTIGETTDRSILVKLHFDYRNLAAIEARERVLRVTARLPEGAELLVDLAGADPELDRHLTSMSCTFHGSAPPSAAAGWRYAIRNLDSDHSSRLAKQDEGVGH